MKLLLLGKTKYSRKLRRGAVAQWLEQLTHNQLAAGSNPARPTTEVDTIKKMFTKIKKIYKSQHVQQFRDTRAIGLVAFGVVAILITWSGVKAVQTNYGLQKQISQLTQQSQVKKLENENLKLSNQYFQTDRFLELAARRQFGKAAPGETVLFVPKSVALSHTTNLPGSSQTKTSESLAKKPTYQRNFQAWINFFLHRQSVDN